MDIFIIRNGEQAGPYDDAAVEALLAQGGVGPQDLAWRNGLPRWLPLAEVMQTHSSTAPEPPKPPEKSLGNAAQDEPATAKQRAFLKYLGAEFPDHLGKARAALAVSDAMENAKLQARIRKWHDEKLRLHPELFQDELDLRRANRASRYLESIQTEGAEVLQDVTKAHVQVIVESLDKRHPNWESEPQRAIWEYLFPSIAEHFPQLVQPAYKGRLKLGAMPRAAAPPPPRAAAGTIAPPPKPPSTFGAMMRGVFLGMLVLGAIVGGLHYWQQRNAGKDDTRQQTAGAPSSETAKPSSADSAGSNDSGAGKLAGAPVKTPPVEPPADPAPSTPPPPPEPPKSEPPMADDKKPAPPTPPEPTKPEPAPMVPPTPAAVPPPPAPTPAPTPVATPVPRTVVTLTAGIAIQLPSGPVTLPAGTKLRLLALDGANVRVSMNNNVFYVPAIATDVDKPVSAPPAAGTPPSGRKPADDL